MNIRFIGAVMALALVAAGCGKGEAVGEVHGDQITMNTETLVAAIMENPTAFDGKEVMLVDNVTGVCQEMGCWLSIDSGIAEEPLIIRFKDDGFTMPKDLAGKRVKVQGIFSTEVAEGHEDHEEEEGKDHECPTGKYSFTASAVAILL